jgi:predicted heme/steroid binding protein
LIVVLLITLATIAVWAQTSTSGAITGTVTDPNGRLIANATVTVIRTATNETRTVQSDRNGAYIVPLLPVGQYRVEISAPGFSTFKLSGVEVFVTEKATVDAKLTIGTVAESIEVTGQAEMVQRESATVGGVVEPNTIVNVPLATRNFTQLLALSTGVDAGVPNATGFGLNSMELSSQGSRETDNGVYINGVDATNVFTNTNGSYVGTQGIAVPAADSLEEFKVQTALYSADTGRHSGANVAVITKSGTNSLHGDAYEYFRNDDMNANDFFSNQLGLPRGALKQNVFGGTVGGPIIKDKLFFFTSYQGTHQVNGIAAGAASSAFLPPLPEDRTAASLGAAFGGETPYAGILPPAYLGYPVASDGSNINPVALALLNDKLPNGQYLIPSPGSESGLAKFVIPAHFTENQFNANVDWQLSSKDQISEKYFYATQDSTLPFNTDSSTPNTLPGSGRLVGGGNQNLSLTWTRTITPTLVNAARFGYTRNVGTSNGQSPVDASAVGMTTPPGVVDLPDIIVAGLFSIGPSYNATQGVFTNVFSYSDSLHWVKGRHTISVGFEAVRNRTSAFDNITEHALLEFFDFPGFLIGQPAITNGSYFSDIFANIDFGGIVAKDYRILDLAGYFQDDYRITNRFTLNLGLRYDFLGSPSDHEGRNSNFVFADALKTPPAGGTNSGYVVGHDTPGTIPPDVIRSGSNTLMNQNLRNFEPRIGFSWQPLASNKLVVRGGYGIYDSNRAAIGNFQNVLGQPYTYIQESVLIPFSTASFQNPFAPLPPASDFPLFIPRTATSSQTGQGQNPDMKTPYTQQYSLGFQYEFKKNFLLDLSYVGSKGTHVIGYYNPNQPLIATAANPVNGLTTTTVGNATQRVPWLGINTQAQYFDSVFYSKYNSLQATVTKRMGHGLQFQTSYTFSKSLDNLSGLGAEEISLASASGDQTNLRQAYGPADFDRTHRLVFSYLWNLPKVSGAPVLVRALANGWANSGILTLQSGTPFSVGDAGAASAYGETNSRAQFAPGYDCHNATLSGSVESRLNEYFNTAAFTTAPVIGDDGAATAFGNSGRNCLRGPGERNFDFALIRHFPLKVLREGMGLEFRAEAFNLFNTPNFSNPSASRTVPSSFGVISGTTINPRILQLALKVNF